jgi:peptidoglycan/LPS O-acetylase OafA/YrhL
MDLARILFAVMVLLAHAPELSDGNANRELLSRWSGVRLNIGGVGVCGFFLLSGSLIVRSWFTDPHLPNFLRKRILRIVPGYAAAYFLSSVVVGALAPDVTGWFRHLDYSFILGALVLSCPHVPPVLRGMPYPNPKVLCSPFSMSSSATWSSAPGAFCGSSARRGCGCLPCWEPL